MNKSTTLYYLASPYTYLNEKVMRRRFETICAVAARLIKNDFFVFSPICHSHTITGTGLVGVDFEAWRAFDLQMLERCDALIICTMAGWRSSVGVRAEFQAAQARTMPIYQCDVHGEVTLMTEETKNSLSE